MTKTIFRNTFLVGFLVLLLCAGLVFWVQYTQTMEETYAALQQEAVYAEQGMLQSGTEYLSSLGKVNRVTWIDGNGGVLYDSEFPLPIANQKDCAEVRAAMSSGEGQGIRTSESSGESTMYYALKCGDGTILRLSRPLSAVQEAWLTVSPVLWLLVVVLLISAALSFRAARKIVKPINNLDLDNPELNTYPELSSLIRRIQEQKETIQEETAQREALRREFSAREETFRINGSTKERPPRHPLRGSVLCMDHRFQISFAYWRMVRSEENLPLQATFIRHLRANAVSSAFASRIA